MTPPSAPTIPGHCMHFAEGARAVEDEVDRAGVAAQRFHRFARAGERVGRAAGGDPVEQRPEERGGQGEGDERGGGGRRGCPSLRQNAA